MSRMAGVRVAMSMINKKYFRVYSEIKARTCTLAGDLVLIVGCGRVEAARSKLL